MPDQNEVDLGALFAEYEKTAAIHVLPAGKHVLEVTSCTVRSKGVCPVYKVTEGPDTGKRVMAGGIYPGDTEGGRQAFFRKLEKFGLGKDFFTLRPSLDDVSKALIGRVVELDLTISDYTGEPRNELAFSIRLISAPGVPAISGVPTIQQASAPVPQVPVVTPVGGSAPPVTASAPVPVVADDDPGF